MSLQGVQTGSSNGKITKHQNIFASDNQIDLQTWHSDHSGAYIHFVMTFGFKLP